jgi:two-component system chemotaxis sensor kinase CheA
LSADSVEPEADLAQMAAAVESETAAASEAPARSAAEPARRNETMAVKVDTAKLDYLVDMAGEMVIAESLVRHDPELGTL